MYLNKFFVKPRIDSAAGGGPWSLWLTGRRSRKESKLFAVECSGIDINLICRARYRATCAVAVWPVTGIPQKRKGLDILYNILYKFSFDEAYQMKILLTLPENSDILKKVLLLFSCTAPRNLATQLLCAKVPKKNFLEVKK